MFSHLCDGELGGGLPCFPAYHGMLAVKRIPAGFRRINGYLPADAGPLHLFDGPAGLRLTAPRAVIEERIGKPADANGDVIMFPINEVLEGDCTRILRRLPDSFVDLVVTDPPYGVRYQDSNGRTIANDDDPNRILGAFKDLYRLLKPDSICISFYGWGQVDAFFRAWRGAGFSPLGHIVWAKDYASRTRYLHYRHEQAYVLAKGSPRMPEDPIDDIQPWVYSGNPDHPTQKAVQILTPLIEAFSAPGQLVLDPFAGSGSTLVAAAMSGRRYLGVELEQRYCRVARERLARVRTRLPQPLAIQAGLDQEEMDLVPADVDGFIQWLREHRLEGVAGVVESAKAEYGW